MKRLQAYRYALRPNKVQSEALAQAAGCRRFVYNRALALQEERFAKGENHLGYGALCALLPQWKKDAATAWLADAPSQALQQSLKDLGRGYSRFFAKQGGKPAFKRKGEHDAFRYPAGVKLDAGNARVFLPNIGWMGLHLSQPLEGEICNATVSCDGDRWMISIQTEREVAEPAPRFDNPVGIDLGVSVFATLSDGTPHKPNAALAKCAKAVKRAQKALSRKKRGSKNRAKAKRRLGRVKAREARVRLDRLHKLSHGIAKNHGVIMLEDLAVKNMTASAKGTVEAPGKGVKAKAGLNRSILNQGWGEFRRQLEYKAAWGGGRVVLVNPAHTSQRCSCCGHVSPENRRSQALFKCVACGHTENADMNAAKNILAAGLAVIAKEQSEANACGGTPSAPLKQEPALASLVA